LVVSFCILLSDWLMDTGFYHLIGSISSDVIGWWYKTFQSSFGLSLRTNKITPQKHFRSRMRAPIFSRGSPTGDVWSDIAQLPVAHARTPPFQGNPFGVTWRLMTSLPVKRPDYGEYCSTSGCAYAHPSKGNPFGVTWRFMTSHQVSMLLPVMRNSTFCTTTIVRKSGNRLSMRTRSLPFTWLPVTSFPVRTASCDVTSGSTTSHHHLRCDFSCNDILLRY
jgi:hypothetical protein